jgi:hypothetical protein
MMVLLGISIQKANSTQSDITLRDGFNRMNKLFNNNTSSTSDVGSSGGSMGGSQNGAAGARHSE